MNLYDRHKKRGIDGFKAVVAECEQLTRTQKLSFLNRGLIEDPVYTFWIMKNLLDADVLKTFNQIELETLIDKMPNGIVQFCRYFAGSEFLNDIIENNFFPKRINWQITDFVKYEKEVTPEQRHSAKVFILKEVRALMETTEIQTTQWDLPGQAVISPLKAPPDGPGTIEYPNGVKAGEGEYYLGKKHNAWVHYYFNGKLHSEGSYVKGTPVGPWKFYAVNGELSEEGEYNEAGDRDGVWKIRNANTGEIEEHYYQDGAMSA